MPKIRVIPGDCVATMKRLAERGELVDAIVCDPPYHLTSIVKRFGGENSAPAKHGTDGAYARASAGFMGQQWDGGDVAFRVETWRAAYEVLKPGGYLLAFSGTRTYHRMAVAIEDAGFEIRDQIGWLYGVGFPKSHDVAKAIDRAAGVEGERGDFKSERHALNAELGRRDPGNSLPSRPWMDDAEAVENMSREYIPATDAAREWNGWGTALKPAQEPIAVGFKHLTPEQLFAVIIERINLEAMLWFSVNAKDVENYFSDIQAICERAGASIVPESAKTNSLASIESARYVAEVFTCHWRTSGEVEKMRDDSARINAKESGNQKTQEALQIQRGAADDISTLLMDMSMSVTMGNMSENIGSLWLKASEEILSRVNTFTISTALKLITELKTLRSCLSLTTSEGTGNISPNLSPIVVARKPLIGTVAENVLAHGTGAMNIDACRVGVREARQLNRNAPGGVDNNGHKGGQTVIDGGAGRFPANVIHDGSEEVIAAFPGEAGAASPVRGCEASAPTKNAYGEYGRVPSTFHNDSGSAARFFYSAKASASERRGSKHPTVKPVALMAYLVRLVTRRGGTVLDPFAGTGTTGEAAYIEGVNAILCEQSPDYIADIKRRIAAVTGDGPHSASLRASARAENGKKAAVDSTPDHGPLFAAAKGEGGA